MNKKTKVIIGIIIFLIVIAVARILIAFGVIGILALGVFLAKPEVYDDVINYREYMSFSDDGSESRGTKWGMDESIWPASINDDSQVAEFKMVYYNPWDAQYLGYLTPGSEVELCGHATLASSFVIFNYFEQNKDVIEFNTLSGKLTIARKGKLAELPGRGQDVSAKGTDTDCVSRSFFPKLLVPEDPVCGSAHCQIADYWSKELGKSEIHAYQASKRGGRLYCKLLENERIKISGEATLVAISDIVVDF